MKTTNTAAAIAELEMLVNLEICTDEHAQRALAHFIANNEDYSTINVWEQVKLSLACTN